MITDGRNKYLAFGDNRDVVANVVACYKRWRLQPKDIVAELRGMSVEDICYSIFCYVLENVQYKVDVAGYQFIKSPARLLSDGEGDCKSMTIFIASCLWCLGISCKIRFVGFGSGSQYTHVYPIATDENGNDIIIDCVERDGQHKPIFNYAREFERNIDFECV